MEPMRIGFEVREENSRMTGWTTRDEVDFLARVGEWTVRTLPISKRELLIRYKETMEYRDDWTGIDKEAVTRLVETLLEMQNEAP